MIRGTTPVVTVETDRDLTGFFRVILTIEDKAGTEVDVVGPGPSLSVTSTKVVAKLTQEQTLALEPGKIRMQIRALDSVGNAVASDILTAKLSDVLKEGVISGP